MSHQAMVYWGNEKQTFESANVRIRRDLSRGIMQTSNDLSYRLRGNLLTLGYTEFGIAPAGSDTKQI